ncbi:hypothetical protein CPSG_05825 [Coccidioides posadasii str. Silveira]|uniref:Uncharacterized protein n=2 Tax=Coccidioides posadasii TaxID=199306 RepID=E9D7M3_COCPS|nr:hypothetical protein CPSG_05825 [Coccidioides posadasii str. Silveira]KMM70970.1 hypothetical protein CPAG_07279 [Coccidioides posadasii RMSCC 3488]
MHPGHGFSASPDPCHCIAWDLDPKRERKPMSRNGLRGNRRLLATPLVLGHPSPSIEFPGMRAREEEQPSHIRWTLPMRQP